MAWLAGRPRPRSCRAIEVSSIVWRRCSRCDGLPPSPGPHVTLGAVPLADVAAACTLAVVMALVLCFRLVGGHKKMVLLDGMMVALTELAAQLVFRTDILLQHVPISAPTRTSCAVGSLMAIVGILLNHLAEKAGPGLG